MNEVRVVEALAVKIESVCPAAGVEEAKEVSNRADVGVEVVTWVAE